MTTTSSPDATIVDDGQTVLGIELGSTRIKACLVDAAHPNRILATGSHAWENTFVDGLWTYSLEAVQRGVQGAFADLAANLNQLHSVPLQRVSTVGVSGMMHGYLPFDVTGTLLTPFRTWRNTTAQRAAAELSDVLNMNVPRRWSVAHLRQAILDDEPHVPYVAYLTTLSGYVHQQLTGRQVIGMGDASGMFPLDGLTGDWDEDRLARFDALTGLHLRALLPEILRAGVSAGELDESGAQWLDPTGTLRPGALTCPPEGDAATGMVATNSIAPRTGNVSVGTSVFSMVVLERPFQRAHGDIDIVATPVGDPVAMVHCNNGASELAAWADLFGIFAGALGAVVSTDEVYQVLFDAAMRSVPDADGVLAFNQLAAEPIVTLSRGAPMVVRHPEGRLTLDTLMRAQLNGVFASLALGMRMLTAKGVSIDRLAAHGGLFRTKGAAQDVLAAALNVPITVSSTAAEGGAWGMAVLASYTGFGGAVPLHRYLDSAVFVDAAEPALVPDPTAVAGYDSYLKRYVAALPAVRIAAEDLT